MALNPLPTTQKMEKTTASSSRPLLGQLLLQAGVIDALQLCKALVYQKTHSVRIGRALLELRFIAEKDLKVSLAHQLGIEFVAMDEVDLIDPQLSTWITQESAIRHTLCPISKVGSTLTVLMDDPTEVSIIADLEGSTKLKIKVATATEVTIAHALRRVYGENISGPEHYGLVIDENFTYDAQRAQAPAQPVRKASA
jgi:hypothetical protein